MGEQAAHPQNVYEGSCFPATWRLLRGPSELLGQQHGLGAGRDKVAGPARVGFSLCVPSVLGQRLAECRA